MEEQRVYAAVLQEMYPAPLLVLEDHTSLGVLEQNLDESLAYLRQFEQFDADLLESFKARNDARYPLTLQLDVEVVLLSRDQIEEIFRNDQGWNAFYRRYPGAPGMITLSRVGFNKQLDQALVHVGCQSHWLAGAGYYVLLKKVEGEWQIEEKWMTWVS